jgi:hypothetical protein
MLLVGVPVREHVLMGESAETVLARYRSGAPTTRYRPVARGMR